VGKGKGKGVVSKDASETTLTAYNYNNACANLKSKARDNLVSAYIDDGEEAKFIFEKRLSKHSCIS
jgi:hypothetical protein